jgi:DNA-binding CsgD family transcriptional regulator
MIDFLKIVVLVLSMAMTSAGILIASHLRTTYKTDFFASLLFFQVFWFTFGFYALWGQIAIASLLSSGVDPELLIKINNAAVFLGSPFLVFAWLMVMKFTREISNRKTGAMFIGSFLALNFLLVPGTGFLLNRFTGIQVMPLLRYTFIFLCILYALAGSWFLFSRGKMTSRLEKAEIKNVALWLILIMAIQNILYFFSKDNEYLNLAFILVFYGFGVMLPVYFRYRADLSKLLVHGEGNLTFDRFCSTFEISKREKEVIHEICKGLSNQEIADKLFISLQTVKDHTHRIYGKTFCTSRAQLIRMVNDGG